MRICSYRVSTHDTSSNFDLYSQRKAVMKRLWIEAVSYQHANVVQVRDSTKQSGWKYRLTIKPHNPLTAHYVTLRALSTNHPINIDLINSTLSPSPFQPHIILSNLIHWHFGQDQLKPKAFKAAYSKRHRVGQLRMKPPPEPNTMLSERAMRMCSVVNPIIILYLKANGFSIVGYHFSWLSILVQV